MKRSTRYIHAIGFFILVCLIFQTCQKDPIPCSECNKCEAFPEPGGGVNFVTVLANSRSVPCFNPNNGNEFIYIKTDSNIYSLVKHDLISEKETVLLK